MRFFSDNAAAACPEVMAALQEANNLDTAYDGDRWSKRLDGVFSTPTSRTTNAARRNSTPTAPSCCSPRGKAPS
jgi:threonine aldolase